MSTYELASNNQTIVLESEKCSAFINDEEQPISGISIDEIIDLMNHSDLVYFSKEYYDQSCEACHKNKKEGGKYYDFLEFHFYLFAKGGKYVMSSLSKAYEETTLPRLLNEGTVDGTYIVSINVCERCGDFTIDMEFGLF